MQDFLLNKDYSMLQIPSDNLIPQTTGVFMSRTIKVIFNIQNRTFDLGYLNYKVDKSVRDSIVHCYYLSIDTRLSQFIEFLVKIDSKQERQSKVNNISQIILNVTLTSQRDTLYNLIIVGDTTGVITFKPSQLIDSKEEGETDLSSLEPLINSIINENKRKAPKNQFKPTNTDYQIISICREIVEASDQASEKIKQLRDLLSQ